MTGPIGWAYNPTTERGAALALRPRHVVAPVMLLIMMSESTADNNRLSFAVETRVHNLPEMEVGSLGPGCLTSEDEERETWTAESLRISEYLKASAFRFSGSDERLRRYTFKGYTIVARDVNRRQLVGFG